MDIAKSLTLENFWNDLKAKYPEGVKVFTDWIDEYKKKVYWDSLFNACYEKSPEAPKFHELPYAFQLGIWLEFMLDRGGCLIEVDFIEYDIREDITGYVANILQPEAEETKK